MRFLYYPLLVFSSLLLESAVVPILLPEWFRPGFDLPLIIVLHLALSKGKNPGMIAGLIVGYLQDAMSGGVLGFNGVSKIIAGFMGGYLKEKFFLRSVAHRTTSVAGAVLFALLAKVLVLTLFAQPRPSLLSLQFLWSFGGNTLFALLIHTVLDQLESAFGIRTEEELSLGD